MTAEHPRAAFERKASALVGSRIVGVRYSDLPEESDPRVWDFGDWHHAVMGAELMLDSGPASITWTSTFDSYGVEVFHEPLPDPQTPHDRENWAVGGEPSWRDRLGVPISAVSFAWHRFEGRSSRRRWWGRWVDGPVEVTVVPDAMRIDFAGGFDPVWFVAAMPGEDDPEKSSSLSDEIIVVFTADKMRRMGLGADEFVNVGGPGPRR